MISPQDDLRKTPDRLAGALVRRRTSPASKRNIINVPRAAGEYGTKVMGPALERLFGASTSARSALN